MEIFSCAYKSFLTFNRRWENSEWRIKLEKTGQRRVECTSSRWCLFALLPSFKYLWLPQVKSLFSRWSGRLAREWWRKHTWARRILKAVLCPMKNSVCLLGNMCQVSVNLALTDIIIVFIHLIGVYCVIRFRSSVLRISKSVVLTENYPVLQQK